MLLMLDEIYEQPNAVTNAIERNITPVAALVNALQENGIRHVVIAARGTSDHAATYAKYLLEIVCGVPVTLSAPSVTTLYDAEVNLSGCLVLGISQSGQATDVVQVLSAARASGATTACITNKSNSPLTSVSDYVLLCSAGRNVLSPRRKPTRRRWRLSLCLPRSGRTIRACAKDCDCCPTRLWRRSPSANPLPKRCNVTAI